MRVRPGWVALAVVAAVASGCHSTPTSGTPTAPSGPALTSLTITPAGGGTMVVGGAVAITSSGTTAGFGAFAQFSDGTARYVEATWTTSDAAVVTIDGARMVARGRGSATVTATFEGRSDDEQFVVEGGVAGSWAGSYTIDQCVASSGSLQEVLCAPPAPGRNTGIAYVGATLPIAMDISESGTSLTGIVSFGQIRGTLTGQNRGAGLFYLAGAIEGGGGAINISHWSARVVRDEMEAFINYQVRIDGLPGLGEVATHLVNVTRR